MSTLIVLLFDINGVNHVIFWCQVIMNPTNRPVTRSFKKILESIGEEVAAGRMAEKSLTVTGGVTGATQEKDITKEEIKEREQSYINKINLLEAQLSSQLEVNKANENKLAEKTAKVEEFKSTFGEIENVKSALEELEERKQFVQQELLVELEELNTTKLALEVAKNRVDTPPSPYYRCRRRRWGR